jgi:cyclohexanone monooxygenase
MTELQRAAARPGPADLDMIVVGAGFAGIRMLHRMRAAGFSVRVLEAGGGIGGVWYWNRYPGARCDVASLDYSYSFSPELDQEWTWSERYATQPEILSYINHVADRFDLHRDIELNTRVTAARFDETEARWSVETDRGERLTATWLIMATGCLSVPRTLDIDGMDSFRGTVYHTADWPHEPVDFTGQRVAVIGTGSSGTQLIPIVAEQAAHLTVFQRTPNFSVPARNAPLPPEEEAELKATYPQRRKQLFNSTSGMSVPVFKESALDATPEQRRERYESQWGRVGFGFVLSYGDLLTDERANETAAEFIRGKIREAVQDPETAEKLTPRGYPFGAKRPCVDSGYYETFNRPNTSLVDLREDPIEAITPSGVRTAGGEHEFDSIVFATGFDAMTGALMRIDIRGRDGLSLRDKWAAGPTTYLGVAVAGFPNMFIVAGPGSPSVLTNVIVSIEQHADWLGELVTYACEQGATTIEAEQSAEDDWVDHVNKTAAATLYPKATSWYLGDNIPGKPRVFMPYVGGIRGYRRVCQGVAERGYEGFTIARSHATLSDKAS